MKPGFRPTDFREDNMFYVVRGFYHLLLLYVVTVSKRKFK
jgi:hypothetical protein